MSFYDLNVYRVTFCGGFFSHTRPINTYRVLEEILRSECLEMVATRYYTLNKHSHIKIRLDLHSSVLHDANAVGSSTQDNCNGGYFRAPNGQEFENVHVQVSSTIRIRQSVGTYERNSQRLIFRHGAAANFVNLQTFYDYYGNIYWNTIRTDCTNKYDMVVIF